jgi:hypothetical protein
MRHNVGDDVPFDFDERPVDPTGRAIRTAAPKPRRERRKPAATAADRHVPLTELLTLSIREVTESQIRTVADDETDLARLLLASIEDVRRRKATEGAK